MGFAEEMTNLGEKLLASYENRMNNEQNRLKDARRLKNNLKEFKEFTENLSDNVDKLRRRFRSEHKTMAKDLREKLHEIPINLSKNVSGFLKKCHKEQAGVHNMFAQAHKNFTNCMKELARKKGHAHKFTEPPPSPKKRGRKKRTAH